MKKNNPKRAIIKEELVKLTGNHALAITLNQLLYWSLRIKDKDKFIREEVEQEDCMVKSIKYGWIYKTSEELSQEIMLGSQTTVRRYLKELTKCEFIFERRNPKYRYDKTYQYRVNLNKIRMELKILGYELNDFNHYYSDKEHINKMDQQNDPPYKQNEHTSNDSVYMANQNEAAIPEITSKNTSKNISIFLTDEEDIRNNNEEVNKIEKITKYYLEKSKKIHLTSKEEDAVKKVALLDLPFSKTKDLFDTCYENFKEKHAGKSIHSFIYLANYVLKEYQGTKSNLDANKKQGVKKRESFTRRTKPNN
ncbi:hypothetical protein [Planomicrobium sp. CPCC 101079]|uniref:hypothetical protein n=1 Tax=Planomicrobium sp. CPCC 101079 TaxID=2599618 RepID=UPI0011B85583|nr:hypothetical protein [Planomicrobium sp. CPCC 101079]TWT00128.1 hypothetical protein FQV28_18595 [Planomicrobium sp. CPCC 101079]